MKDLITSVACIAILFAFLVQFTQNQVIYSRIMTIENDVNAFKEVVKQEGEISYHNKDELKEVLSEVVGCSKTEIIITGTAGKIKRGGRIYYKVIVPIKNIIGADNFWKITDKENQFDYTINRCTTSELI